MGSRGSCVRGLRVTLALLIPIGFAYAVIAQPLIQLALHHGRVSESGAHLVSQSLALFAIGLPGFSAFFLLIRGYQAMQDARTMFLIYAAENALTVVLALVLDPLLGVPGLALAWVAPYTIACWVAGRGLRKRGVSLGGATTTRAIVRIVAAGVLTAGAVFAVGLVFSSSGGGLAIAVRLTAQAAVGTAVYVVRADPRHPRVGAGDRDDQALRRAEPTPAAVALGRNRIAPATTPGHTGAPAQPFAPSWVVAVGPPRRSTKSFIGSPPWPLTQRKPISPGRLRYKSMSGSHKSRLATGLRWPLSHPLASHACHHLSRKQLTT